MFARPVALVVLAATSLEPLSAQNSKKLCQERLGSREANSPECRQFVAEFVSDERNEMLALFYRSLRAIELALSARREYMTKEGQIIYGGPDHYARLAATKHLRDFLSAGRPAPKQPEKEGRRLMTLQEVEELLNEDEAKKQALLTALSDG